MSELEASTESPSGRVLIVDDARFTRTILERMLTSLGHETLSATTGVEALEALAPDIDLILLDVVMPEMSGFEVAAQIRAGGYCEDVPIIMVTSSGSMHDRLTAVEAGASDFICKPVEEMELRVRVASQLKIKRAQDSAKSYTADVERVVFERTQSLEEANGKLARLATTDALTGLPNHRSLVAALEHEIEKCGKTGASCAVLFADVDHFKALNDTFGHPAGDAVLKGFADITNKIFEGNGICGRWGGEEFVGILPGTDIVTAQKIAEELRHAISAHQFVPGTGLTVTCSIGIANFPNDGLSRSEIAEAADRAMYVAKKLGRNQVRTASEIDTSFLVLEQGGSDSREEVALEGLINALTAIIATRDPETAVLAQETESIALRIASTLGWQPDEMRLLDLVARLHGIGKVGIPDAILRKRAPLTHAELDRMREHPILGAQIVSHVPALRGIANAIRALGEHWDGSGHPDGLAGESIPAASRVVALAEACAILTTPLPGRPHLAPLEAMKWIQSRSQGQFDPAMVEALDEVLRQRLTAA